MTLTEQAQRDAINIVSDVPVSFTFTGATYTGTRGALVSQKRFGEGGFLTDPDLTITTSLKKKDGAGKLINRFTTEPVNGDKVTFDSVEYRVSRTVKDEFGSMLQMDLDTPHKGAL